MFFGILFGTSVLGTVSFEKVVAVEGDVVHSAQAADYNKDGLKDLIFSGGGGVNLALAPEFEVIQIATTPAPLKPNCIYSTIMDVDNDGDMDFLGCNRGLYWLECPDNPVDPKQWKLHWITKAFSGTHCITVHDVDEDGKQDIVANNFYPEGHAIDRTALGARRSSEPAPHRRYERAGSSTSAGLREAVVPRPKRGG